MVISILVWSGCLHYNIVGHVTYFLVYLTILQVFSSRAWVSVALVAARIGAGIRFLQGGETNNKSAHLMIELVETNNKSAHLMIELIKL